MYEFPKKFTIRNLPEAVRLVKEMYPKYQI